MSKAYSERDWVTIVQTVWPHEAHLIAGRLREEGIDAVVADENIVQMQGFASHAVGGVKVKVHKEDELRARDLLKDEEMDDDSGAELN